MEDVYPVRLVVNRQDGGYRARWIEEDGQESEPFALDLPLKEEDAADLRWYLEKYGDFVGAGTRKRAQGIERPSAMPSWRSWSSGTAREGMAPGWPNWPNRCSL